MDMITNECSSIICLTFHLERLQCPIQTFHKGPIFEAEALPHFVLQSLECCFLQVGTAIIMVMVEVWIQILEFLVL